MCFRFSYTCMMFICLMNILSFSRPFRYIVNETQIARNVINKLLKTILFKSYNVGATKDFLVVHFGLKSLHLSIINICWSSKVVGRVLWISHSFGFRFLIYLSEINPAVLFCFLFIVYTFCFSDKYGNNS